MKKIRSLLKQKLNIYWPFVVRLRQKLSNRRCAQVSLSKETNVKSPARILREPQDEQIAWSQKKFIVFAAVAMLYSAGLQATDKQPIPRHKTTCMQRCAATRQRCTRMLSKLCDLILGEVPSAARSSNGYSWHDEAFLPSYGSPYSDSPQQKRQS